MKVRDISNVPNDKNKNYSVDSLKMRYMLKFIEKAKGSQITFVISPIWYGSDALVIEPIRELCQRSHIRLIDFTDSPKYVHNNDYFMDGNHLNNTGADEFTKDLIEILKN